MPLVEHIECLSVARCVGEHEAFVRLLIRLAGLFFAFVQISDSQPIDALHQQHFELVLDDLQPWLAGILDQSAEKQAIEAACESLRGLLEGMGSLDATGYEALERACVERFRPIVVTTLTTSTSGSASRSR